MVRLIAGKQIRSANRHFFNESGIRNGRQEKQHPFLVMRPTKTRLNIDVVYSAPELLEYPDSTKILAQWKGKKRSDYYRFTVRELRDHLSENPPSGRQRI